MAGQTGAEEFDAVRGLSNPPVVETYQARLLFEITGRW
jgi:hypothetical protein